MQKRGTFTISVLEVLGYHAANRVNPRREGVSAHHLLLQLLKFPKFLEQE